MAYICGATLWQEMRNMVQVPIVGLPICLCKSKSQNTSFWFYRFSSHKPQSLEGKLLAGVNYKKFLTSWLDSSFRSTCEQNFFVCKLFFLYFYIITTGEPCFSLGYSLAAKCLFIRFFLKSSYKLPCIF